MRISDWSSDVCSSDLQSINTPLIGMGQPNLAYFEPAWADEVAAMMRWSFEHLQRPDGSSVYLRLSTRSIPQIAREDDSWRDDALKGGYWLRRPAEDAEAAVVFTGAVAPEALPAWAQPAEDRSDERSVGEGWVSRGQYRGGRHNLK